MWYLNRGNRLDMNVQVEEHILDPLLIGSLWLNMFYLCRKPGLQASPVKAFR
jgi:hypothetical protein